MSNLKPKPMVAHTPKRRIGIVIQCRQDSCRLPGKALVDLCGEPLLTRLIERLHLCKTVDVMAVSTSYSSHAIIEYCQNQGMICHAGSEEDLLARHLNTAKRENLTMMIRVTADNPLTDPKGIDDLVSAYEKHGCAYTHNVHPLGYIYGTGAELFDIGLLEKSDAIQTSQRNRWMILDRESRNEEYQALAPSNLHRPDYFLTVDYSEDVELMEHIYSQFNGDNATSLSDIVVYLDRHPELTALNRHLHSWKNYPAPAMTK